MRICLKLAGIIPFILAMFFFSETLSAQGEPEYDELFVLVNVRGVGSGEMFSVIKGNDLYLPVTEFFDFLKIKNSASIGLDSISGFFINPEDTYLIERISNRIVFKDKVYNLDPGDLLRTETNLYINSKYLGSIFGLNCKFNFRSLSVTVDSEKELPVIREMKQEELRRNINRLKGEVVVDTTIERTYPKFHFGMADWSVIATQPINGQSEARGYLSLGSIIAGGEMTATLNYSTTQPFIEKQQYYRWRYVDNDRNAWRQITAGKINTFATSTIYNPVVGAQITNTPTTLRKSYGTYNISDKTEPGWIVELYVNNVLINYVTADASGFYSFEVPIVYGSSVIRLKFYGPWGEERTKEQTINIPFTFLPEKAFEYTASAGVVEDTLSSIFARVSLGYGLSKGISLDGGMEYLSAISSGPVMPYLKTSVRVASGILLSGEYTYGVRSKASFSYRLPSNIQVDLNYTIYDKDQKAINYNYRQERKLALSIPLKIGKFSSYNRIAINQFILPRTKYTSGEWMFSAPVFGINTNLTTYALFYGQKRTNIYSNLALSLRLPAHISMMPQAQYSFTDNSLISAKIRFEKPILTNGFLTATYEQNFRYEIKSAEIGFRYDFSFAQTGVSVRRSNDVTTFVEYARGSIINDRQTGYIGGKKYMNVGKGGITIAPYLDYNANGIKDHGEPRVEGLKVHATSGNIERGEQDTIIRVLGLEPYTTCYIELDEYSFDNIAWKLKTKSLAVKVDPNKLKLIEVPVYVMGEATGMVTIDERGEQRGLSRIIVNFYTGENRFVGRTLTESDGYFSYLGFKPGNYIARIDSAQMRKLELGSLPESRTFTIKKDVYGDIIDGLDFTVSGIAIEIIKGDTVGIVKDTTKPVTERIKQIVRKDTTVMVVHEETREVISALKDEYVIQIGAFKRKTNAEALKRKLAAKLNRNVEIVNEDGFYKVRITGFDTKEEINSFIPVLKENGITDMWVINMKAQKHDWVTSIKQDTTVLSTYSVVEAEKVVPEVRDISIQVGAFRSRQRANMLKKRTKEAIDNPVEIIEEDGYYKVRIIGFRNIQEMNNLLPTLASNGYKNIWLLPMEEEIDVPESTIRRVSVLKPELAPVPAAIPTVALQVGTFYKKRLANIAMRKISKGIGRDVTVKKQWDYYTIYVTGFYTKEETYKYYPEIAGIGYPEIYLILNYKAK